MKTTIATVTLDCRTKISDLLAAVTGDGCYASDVLHSRDVEQMQDRFNQWAGNLGALQSFASPKSLEHRLRDAPLIRDSILHNLADLSSSIQAGKFPFMWARDMLMITSHRYHPGQTRK